MTALYSTTPWRELRERVLERDAECALALLAGNCLGPLNVHHIDPVEEGGDPLPEEERLVTLCHRHHRMLHGFLNRQRKWKTCPHQHRTREAREQCEQRLNAA